MRGWLVIALAACSSPSDDVTGPFTGRTESFAVDAITVARDSAEASQFAADLDGDGAPDNQLGSVTAVLASTNDLTPNSRDMIGAGVLSSSVTIQADDLEHDDSVGVTYFGGEGYPATIAGGRFVAGALITNRTRDTRAPGRARVKLPIFVNADPLVLDLEGVEIELTPDGHGGYDGIVRGGIREEHARAAAHAGLVQMFETEPERHLVFARTIDIDRDDVITRAEVDESVVGLLVSADVAMFDGDFYAPRPTGTPDVLSVAFGIHLTPCVTECWGVGVVDACRDRERKGFESDIDCGGPCQPCAAGKRCDLAVDCQSGACDAGVCRAASCSDGVRDGYESDVDCGGSCPACGAGARCAADTDCASGACDNGIASLGTCQ